MYAAVKKQQYWEKKKRNKQDRTEEDKYKSKYSITHLIFTVELWLNVSCDDDGKEAERSPYMTVVLNIITIIIISSLFTVTIYVYYQVLIWSNNTGPNVWKKVLTWSSKNLPRLASRSPYWVVISKCDSIYRVVENGQLIVNRIRWMMMMMMIKY